MVPNLRSPKAATGIVLAAVVAAAGVAEIALSHPSLSGALPKQNLFGIAAHMQSTTGSMLANTKALQSRVQTVNQQLSQLSQQEQILSQQQQTSQQMTAALSRQQQLTTNGVSLMRNILNREKTTRSITKSVADETNQLSGNVLQSEAVLTNLANSIQVTNQESVQLNGQMDELLSALNTSLDEFKLFGQIDQLLTNPLSVGSHLPALAHGVTSTLTQTVGKAGKTVLGAVGNATNSVNQSTGNALGNTLNSLGGLTGLK